MMVINEKESDAIESEMRLICNRLIERGCDSVQIVTTALYEGDTTISHFQGAGNMFARYGAVQEWMESQKNGELSKYIASSINPDDY